MRLVCAALLLAASLAAAAERPEEFGYSVALSPEGDGPLYAVDIPAPVYEGTARGDLADLRVFNAAGEVVPHAFKPRPAPQTASGSLVSLPFFPILATRGTAVEGLDIRVERSVAGTIARVTSKPGPVGTERIVAAYLIDASGFKQPIKALQLDWRPAQDGTSSLARVEGSEDLSSWRTIATSISLVSLQFGGHRLEQKTAELDVGTHKYLRLSWMSGQQPLDLTAVHARPGDVTVEAPRAWKSAHAAPVKGKDGDYEVDLGGQFPTDRLRVALPQVNTVVSAQFLSRTRPEQQWRLATSAVLYSLQRNDRTLTNPDVSVYLNHDRYWLIRIDQRGGGIGSGELVMQAGWVPQQLVFVGRGGGPFQLAYGNSRAQPSALSIETLVPGYRTTEELKATTVRAGEPRTLAGPAALRPRLDYKVWSLWGVLVLGVALLAWMALRLARQMPATSSGKSAAGREPGNP
jgi:hypothetical protein